MKGVGSREIAKRTDSRHKDEEGPVQREKWRETFREKFIIHSDKLS